MPPPSALVLGAGPGIGLAAARRFAREGLAVGLVTRPGLPLPGAPGTVIEAHLADPAAFGTALEELLTRLGPPSLVLFNGSCGTPGPASALDLEAFEADLRANGRALLQSAQAVLPAFRAQGHGTFLVTGGGLAFEPKPDLASASAGKALQRSLALALAHELAPQNLHVASLAVCGFVQQDTPLSPEAVAEALWQLHIEPREAWTFEARMP